VFQLDTYNVVTNIGGIVGGQNNTVNNFSSEQKEDLSLLLSQFQSAVNHLDVSQEQKEEAKDYIDAIAEEAAQDKPKKSIIKVAFAGLKKFATNDTLWKLIEKLTPIISILIK
jgi:uncharacterized protein YfaT (DUF1175 family)